MDDVLKQCQNIQYNLLKEFDRVCKEQGWIYWLDGGTLLGAIRHKGFIPWDDDIDLVMPRKDYEEFKENGQKYLSANTFLQTYQTDKYDDFLLFKLRNRKSTIIEKSEKNKKVVYHQGIFIDIFPIDTIKRKAHKRVLDIYRVYDFLIIMGKAIFVPKIASIKRKLLGLLIFPLAILVRIIFKVEYNYRFFAYKTMHAYYTKRYVTNFEDDLYFMPFMCTKAPNLFLERGDIFPLATTIFEGDYFPIPLNFDKYLSLQYGDYMKLPEENRRTIHSYAILPDVVCNHPESFK
jgi:lipopolysaccharide cholinephosphotransferase